MRDLPEMAGVHLLNSKILTPSVGPVTHPDQRMHLKLSDMGSAGMKPEGWEKISYRKQGF